MRHNKDDKRFSRTGGHLRCMMANMTNSLIEKGRIQTTTPKAKLLRRYVERMITLGKSGSQPARRRAMAFMRDKTIVTRLFTDVAPRYRERNGGYTRILKTGFRAGDCAPMSIIELVEADTEKKAATSAGRRRAAAGRRRAAASKKTESAAKGEETKKKAPAKKTAVKASAADKPAAKKAPPKKTAAKKTAETKKKDKED
jgi:large subunit ribosomal protein L17